MKRDQPLKESNIKDAKAMRAATKKKKKTSGEQFLDRFDLGEGVSARGSNVNYALTSHTAKKVGKISPTGQHQIDKLSFKALDEDFGLVPKTVTPKKKVTEKVKYFPSDAESDFESPNLLVSRPRKVAGLSLKLKTTSESSKTKKDKSDVNDDDEESKKSKNSKSSKEMVETNDKKDALKKKDESSRKKANLDDKVDIEEDDGGDLFASQNSGSSVEVIEDTRPARISRARSVKSENKWGMERRDFNDLSESEKKRFSSKQSKIDGFFKNPPAKQLNNDFIRVNQADTNMEKALKMSREAAERDVESVETNKENVVNGPGPAKPTFAHVIPTVRKKEERMKLYGFDCPECEEYYQQKLEEGFTKDQILDLMNKCSRHRGLFKPPLTPEKFWDVSMMSSDPLDPRNQTQPGEGLKSRAQRLAEKKKKLKKKLAEEEEEDSK